MQCDNVPIKVLFSVSDSSLPFHYYHRLILFKNVCRSGVSKIRPCSQNQLGKESNPARLHGLGEEWHRFWLFNDVVLSVIAFATFILHQSTIHY